jgi:RNA polymerase sigma-70 factor, ECF subfamily
MTEEGIIRLAQTGDAAAFEHLYRAYRQRVYAICFRITRDVAAADDLTQDVFLQLFRKIHTFRSESAFSTWLYRLAVNLVLMNRRRKRVKETSLEETSEMEGGNPPVKEFGQTDQHLSGVADRVTLKRALKQLPPGYRKIFLLHDLLGYEHHEIAQALGRSDGTCKSQLHKARMRLRTILKGCRATMPIPETCPSE